MNFKKMIFSALLFGASLCGTAAGQKTEIVDVFKPHWYIQAQGGLQYTLGEIRFGDLLSPNVQLSAGYNFSPIWGVRVGVNGWQSKAVFSKPLHEWKWNYVAPNADVTINLINLLGEYNANRKFDFSWFAGIGVNVGFNNDEAHDADVALSGITQKVENLSSLWDGTKARLQGRTGFIADYHFNDRWSAGLEIQANLISDHYNSKGSNNPDWYFNGLIGVKYNFKAKKTKKEVLVPMPEEKIVERVVERIVEKPVTERVVVVEPLRRDIFFSINKTNVTEKEMLKVKDIADYLKKYPKATVSIVGYADKNTGNAEINKKLSEKRAASITEILTKTHGIEASRIKSDSKGDTEQPFEGAEMNRVSICIAK